MKLNFLNNKNKVPFYMHTLYSNCDASKYYTHLTAIKRKHGLFSQLALSGVTFSSHMQEHCPSVLTEFPKIWWEAMALRADSQQDKCMGRAPENSKERTVSFSHTLWPNLNGPYHTSVQGRGEQGPNKLERIILEQSFDSDSPVPPTRGNEDRCKRSSVIGGATLEGDHF